jgi:O-antigen/teichoic acid export membrane protein
MAAGYAMLAAAAVYSFATVPIALHYLSKERFALWALMSTISGYLSLIDLGMSSSVARLLIDHKDQQENGGYGSLIKTGWLVLVTQGALVFLAGLLLAPAVSDLLRIQPDLRNEFIQLMRWQSAVLGLAFAVRIFSHLLLAHQRIDIWNYSQIGGLGLNFILLWSFFHANQGVFSMIWALLVSSLAGAAVLLLACSRLRLFPPARAWGRVSWHCFKELFDYGKDLFLVALGNQLIMASQTMIITRLLGLQTAALWSIGTRAFTMVSQLICRIADVSGPAFCEMMARGEQALLRDRYKAVLILTASASGFAAVTFALCNGPFMTVWTHGKFAWPPLNDVLLGVWMVVVAPPRCHNAFVLLTKRVGFMRYVYFVEGSVFVTAAFLVAKRGGLPAIMLCSIGCSTAFSGAYGIWRISRYFGLSTREVGLDWLAPMSRVLALFGSVAVAAWWGCQDVADLPVRLALMALLSGSIGFYIFLRYGLPGGVQRELLDRAPGTINSILRRVLVRTSQ